MNSGEVVFITNKKDKNTASFRLRCSRVVEGLKSNGINVKIYSGSERPKKVIFSKFYDSKALNYAQYFKNQYGSKLYLDICDNHFYTHKMDGLCKRRIQNLLRMIETVDVLIVSSKYLKKVVLDKTASKKPIYVIEDLVEFKSPGLPFHTKKIIQYVFYLAYAFFLSLHFNRDRLKIVWFGNHGSKYAEGGMNDIKSLKSNLESLNDNKKILLTIISNSYLQYKSVLKEIKVPSYYLPYDYEYISFALSRNNVCIIPIVKNEFTLSKTANRLTTALAHSLQVYADSIPSYQYFKNISYLNKWDDLALLGWDSIQLRKKKTHKIIDYLVNYNSNILNRWKRLID